MCGKQYVVNCFARGFGVTLILYTDDEGLEKSINVAFTSLNIVNHFIEISNGRCDFLYDDMVELNQEMQKISDRIECIAPYCNPTAQLEYLYSR
jgi:hypothetical protein